LASEPPPAPGLYHYLRQAEGENTRFHLRIDHSGAGLLLANATAAARLSAPGVVIAKGLLDGDSPQVIGRRLVRRFHSVTPEDAAADLEQVRQIIATLAAPGDNYPILNLADPAFVGQAEPLDKPLSADLPLAEPARVVPLLDRLWDLGIPHVTFIAGEQPNPAALVRLVEHAEDLGLIAGVRGRGSVLAEGSLIQDLAAAGVDHVNLLYLSASPEVHDALAGAGDHQAAEEALSRTEKSEVCAVAEVALVQSTVSAMEATIAALVRGGVTNVCFYALAADDPASAGGALPADALLPAAKLVEELADESQVRFLWYPPVRFDPGRPLDRQVCLGPRCSGDHAVRVEPDGTVIPPRGPRLSAGNLFNDTWETIHGSAAFEQYRRRLAADTHCPDCPGLAICAADCPRDRAGWAE